jgi:hypothetical protein
MPVTEFDRLRCLIDNEVFTRPTSNKLGELYPFQRGWNEAIKMCLERIDMIEQGTGIVVPIKSDEDEIRNALMGGT